MKIQLEERRCAYCGKKIIQWIGVCIHIEPGGAVEDDSDGELSFILCPKCYHKFYDGSISMHCISRKCEVEDGYSKYFQRFAGSRHFETKLPQVGYRG